MSQATPDTIPASDFVAMFFAVWDELLGTPDGSAAAMYVLDPASDWRATLASLTAELASRTPLAGGTSIAAHTAHAAYFLEVFENVILNRPHTMNWAGSFLPAAVDAAGWAATQARLFDVAGRVEALIRGNPKWQPEHVRGGLVNLAHLAYHLGAVRQLLHGAKG